MSFRARLALLGVLGLLFAGFAPRLEAQFPKRLKDAVKKTAEDKAIKKTTDAEGNAIDTLTSGGSGGVRQFLIGSYQIDGARLQAKGLGETKPVAPNDTPEGRQSNRRVELVKM